ncbi:DUF2524 domain-containing protein [Paenibacillus sp. TAB 01]|uniref:DUF2524 domain-containing protein n=1 Tax=Paenibacillus sp. TAB 01 TaxID=3368988 RepID=UPI003753CD36
MTDNLNSQYDCASAGEDLHQLQEQLNALHNEQGAATSKEQSDLINRLENQIQFIKNKCDIRP